MNYSKSKRYLFDFANPFGLEFNSNMLSIYKIGNYCS